MEVSTGESSVVTGSAHIWMPRNKRSGLRKSSGPDLVIISPSSIFRCLSPLWKRARPKRNDGYARLSFCLNGPSGMLMKIAIGSDHAGCRYKEKIKQYLAGLGHEVTDFGTDSEEPVDYPLFIRPVALAVAAAEVERGVVLGGSGNGEAMAANRVKGVRCALCWNIETARLGRQHNDANVISIGQRLVTENEAIAIVDTWLATQFEGGRHTRRIQKLDEEF